MRDRGRKSFVKFFAYDTKIFFPFVKNDKIRFLVQKNIDSWKKMWYDNKVKSAVLWAKPNNRCKKRSFVL